MWAGHGRLYYEASLRRGAALDRHIHAAWGQIAGPVIFKIIVRFVRAATPTHLTMRWSERRTAVRATFEMTSTLPLRATRALVRRRSSCSR